MLLFVQSEEDAGSHTEQVIKTSYPCPGFCDPSSYKENDAFIAIINKIKGLDLLACLRESCPPSVALNSASLLKHLPVYCPTLTSPVSPSAPQCSSHFCREPSLRLEVHMQCCKSLLQSLTQHLSLERFAKLESCVNPMWHRVFIILLNVFSHRQIRTEL